MVNNADRGTKYGDDQPGDLYSNGPRNLSDISVQEYRALAQFRYLIRQFLKTSEDLARAMSLTPQQHQLMLAIAGKPPEALPTVGYLAERLMIEHHSAVGLVDRLAEQGLVEREISAVDRRQVLVWLTERGTAILRELAASHHAELRSSGPLLVRALTSLMNMK